MEIHKDLLEILRVFDNICTLHEIQYSLHGGTMLGAVREQGFIAWDDDADITMTRDNFAKLVDVLDTAESEYLVKGRIKKQFYRADYNHIWIDIFICDYISENSLQQKLKLYLLTALDIMHRDRVSMRLSNLENYGKAKQLIYKIAFLIGQIFPKKWIAYCYTGVSEKWFLGKKENMFRSNDQYIGRMLVFPAIWMKEFQYVQFEDVMLPVSNKSHDFLTQSYGDDYMTPIRENRNAEVHDFVRAAQKIEL